MKYKKQEDVFTSVLFTDESFRRFEKFLIKNFSKLSYSGELIDGTDVTFSNSEELLEYSNNDNKRLIKLVISGRHNYSSDDDERILTIVFRSLRGMVKPEAATYFLEYNNRQWGFSFDDEIKDEIKQLAPDYNYFTFFSIGLIFSFIWLAWSVSVIANKIIVGGKNSLIQEIKIISNNFWTTLIICILFAIPYAFVVNILDKIRDYLFPVFFIAIGNQVASYNRRRVLANFILVTVVISMVLGLIVNFIYDKIK